MKEGLSLEQEGADYIVGWFDVLGFKSVLKNTPHEVLQKEIMPYLDDLKANLVGATIKASASHPQIRKVIESIKIRVISDSIAVFCPLTGEEWQCWLAFLEYTRTLNASMFKEGLPLRGAITVGNVWIRDWGLFGAPIVRAHELGADVDMAVSVVMSDAVDAMTLAFKSPDSAKKSIASLVDWYDVPLKSTNCRRRLMVQLFGVGFYSREVENVEVFVKNRFQMHGKTIEDHSILQKLQNTTSFMQWDMWCAGAI
jgi:hypothetical protein